MTELLNNRRSFLHSATALVAGAGLAQTSANAASAHQGPLTKRWSEQRWTWTTPFALWAWTGINPGPFIYPRLAALLQRGTS